MLCQQVFLFGFEFFFAYLTFRVTFFQNVDCLRTRARMLTAYFAHNPYDKSNEQCPENNHHNAASEPSHAPPIVVIESVHHTYVLILLMRNANKLMASNAIIYHITRPETNVAIVITFSPRPTVVWRAYCMNAGRIPGDSTTPAKQTTYTILIHTAVTFRSCVMLIIAIV